MPEEEYKKALNTALKKLSFKDRTVCEITDILEKKGFDGEVTGKVMEYLKKNNLVNDNLYAQRYIENFIKNKGKGKLYIIQKLLQKGIEKHIIDSITENITEESEYETALKEAERKNTKDFSRLFLFLKQRGFKNTIALKVVKILKDKEDIDF